jgi:hypothetical protein
MIKAIKSLKNPFKVYHLRSLSELGAQFVKYPSYDLDCGWLADTFDNMKCDDTAIITCGIGNIRIYNRAYPEMKKALIKGAKFYVLAGPALNIPDVSEIPENDKEKFLKQESIYKNALSRLLLEHPENFKLYSSVKKQKWHYRVFGNERCGYEKLCTFSRHGFDMPAGLMEIYCHHPKAGEDFKNAFWEYINNNNLSPVSNPSESFVFCTKRDLEAMLSHVSLPELENLKLNEIKGLQDKIHNKK